MRPLNDNAAATGRKLRIAEGLVACIALIVVAIALASADDASAATGSAKDAAPAETTAPAAAAETSEGATAAPRQGPRPRIRHAKLDRSRMILGAKRGVTFRFELAGRQPRKVLVKVARVGSDKVQKRFRLGDVQPGRRQRVSWKGRTGKRGYIRQGKYAFRVYSGGERAEVGAHSSSSRFGFSGGSSLRINARPAAMVSVKLISAMPMAAGQSWTTNWGSGRISDGNPVGTWPTVLTP